MAEQGTEEARVARLADAVANALNADVLLYVGSIEDPADDRVIDLCKERARRPNVALLLTTYGGDADIAYRIARCLQRNYERITVIVDGACKSAGTLIALGADELVLSDYGELGPLDVQVLKEDDIMVRRSGLTPTQSLLSLQSTCFTTFRNHFFGMRFGMQLPTRMAAQVASEMTIGAFKEVYSQIDPMRLGEIDRAMNVAQSYAERLTKGRRNLRVDALSTLLAGYPSHEFVIDRQEAETLFNAVREPSDEEQKLLGEVGICRVPPERATKVIEFLSSAAAGVISSTTAEDKDVTGDSAEHQAAATDAGAQNGAASRSNEQEQHVDGADLRTTPARPKVASRISAAATRRP